MSSLLGSTTCSGNVLTNASAHSGTSQREDSSSWRRAASMHARAPDSRLGSSGRQVVPAGRSPRWNRSVHARTHLRTAATPRSTALRRCRRQVASPAVSPSGLCVSSQYSVAWIEYTRAASRTRGGARRRARHSEKPAVGWQFRSRSMHVAQDADPASSPHARTIRKRARLSARSMQRAVRSMPSSQVVAPASHLRRQRLRPTATALLALTSTRRQVRSVGVRDVGGPGGTVQVPRRVAVTDSSGVLESG